MKFEYKTIALLFMLLCGGIKATAQKEMLKVYGNLGLGGAVSIPTFEDLEAGLVDFRFPSVAILYHRGGIKYLELELTNLVFQREPDDSTDTKLSGGLRVEFGKHLLENRTKGIRMSLGWSCRGYASLEQLNQFNIYGLAVENKVYGLALGFHPHLEYKLWKKVGVDIGPCIEVANIAFRSEYVYDNAIEEDQRGSIDFYFKGMQTFLRAGIYWDLR